MSASRSVRRSLHRVLGCAAGLTLLATACSDDDASPGDDIEPAGEVVGEGDTYEAVIRRTDGGVPHITGASRADVAFGQGYASAEDRACDLADQVLKIRGERARWHGSGEGDVNVNSDIAWRVLGVFDSASEDLDDASAEVREVVNAFVEGWNTHLQEVGIDGLSGWCAGEEWVQPIEPVDLYAYARSIAVYASGAAIADFLATAQPPDIDDAGAEADSNEAAAPVVDLTPPAEQSGSNAWAIGSERSAGGGGMLVANPHFPWEGELRFWEVHLTVPGEFDAYGVQLSGLPGIGIGFTDSFGWSHTVSAGNRFTAYRLDLVDGDPTSYHYGDEERQMTSTDITVEVLGDDGSVDEVTRRVWSTHYGPVLDFPGLGWSEEQTLTYRDANIDNGEIFDQYLSMIEAADLDEFIDVHETAQGVPLFNTVAVSADGRAWYADTSATPNLSDEAIAAFDAALEDDPLVAAAADQGAVLLDGSDPEFEWVEAEGARDPGLVPFADMPMVERDDYVFNANDSFWVPHATEVLDGDYSPLHGRQGTPRSPRTRENAVVLDDTSAEGPAGDDGVFTLDELADAALQNRGYTSRALLDDVVDRCQGTDAVEVPAVTGDDGAEVLPAGTVEISEACDLLGNWDGVYDLDRAGPLVWREMMHRVGSDELGDAGSLWDEAFDPDRPVETPSGLAPAPDEGPDPVLEYLAQAVQVLEVAGLAVDATLGEVQFALRDGQVVPIHGGDNLDGVTNIVGYGSMHSILDPALAEIQRETVVGGSSLATIEEPGGEHTGYLVNSGTSFLMALEFTDDGPEARVFLTYSNTEDRSNPDYTAATERFSDKDWRAVPLTADDIEAATIDAKTVRG
jgi:acyl-homoserine-lactone acylase